jgi:hypothetical protein
MVPPPGGIPTSPCGFTFVAPSAFSPKDSRVRCTPWSVFQDGAFKSISTASRLCGTPVRGESAQMLLGPARAVRGGDRIAAPRPQPVARAEPTQSAMARAKPLRSRRSQRAPDTLLLNGCPSSNFRFFLQPFLASFHLSLTVLVRYRSPVHI